MILESLFFFSLYIIFGLQIAWDQRYAQQCSPTHMQRRHDACLPHLRSAKRELAVLVPSKAPTAVSRKPYVGHSSTATRRECNVLEETCLSQRYRNDQRMISSMSKFGLTAVTAALAAVALAQDGTASLPATVAAVASRAPEAMATPIKVMFVGDSITHGHEGDYTWRYRMWEWFRANNISFDFVGPYTGQCRFVHMEWSRFDGLQVRLPLRSPSHLNLPDPFKIRPRRPVLILIRGLLGVMPRISIPISMPTILLLQVIVPTGSMVSLRDE